MNLPTPSIEIIAGRNDQLFSADGRVWTDLFSAHGTTWLGHANPRIAAAIAQQLGQIWNTGGLGSPLLREARTLIAKFFPSAYRSEAIYSTGMEAAEYVMRATVIETGRPKLIGFQGNMHGKSIGTSTLGWSNDFNRLIESTEQFPFIDREEEDHLLERVSRRLAQQDCAALFVEPCQGSHGGWTASVRFYQQLAHECAATGTKLVFDELLTGWYRTGPCFTFLEMQMEPDYVLIGKALGNGFPVSAVVRRVDAEASSIDAQLTFRKLPGSTFAGNPLACAAIIATLNELTDRKISTRVAQIHAIISDRLSNRSSTNIAIRGQGAFWVVSLAPQIDATQVVGRLYEQGVAIGTAGNDLRLLPAATIDFTRLDDACCRIADTLGALV